MKKELIQEIGLKKDLGLFTTTAAGVGVILGAGIYVLIGVAAGIAGNAVWLSFLISALVAIFTGFSYAELSSMFTKDSGEYEYVKQGLGSRLGFMALYSILIAGITSGTTVALGFSGYLAKLIGNVPIWLPAAVLIIIFTIVNIRGIKHSASLNVIFTLVEVAGLLLIIFISVPYIGDVNYLDMAKGFTGVLNAAALVFFAFIGFEGVIKLSEETKNPEKTIPRALLLSIAISSIIYLLVAIAAVSVIGWETLGQSSSPLADVAQHVLGSGAGLFLTLIALVSTGNTVLLTLLMASRTFYGFGEEINKLKFLSKVNSKTRTPVTSIIITMVVALAFLFLKKIEVIAEIANFSIFLAFALVNLSLIRLRYKLPKKKRRFRSPCNFGKCSVMAVLGFIISLFMMLNLQLYVIGWGIFLTAIGLILGEIFNGKNK
ncbi:MAG: APC family permease [Candidatus Nanoarchaeia archaeon]|nr:APC family permease [Candidatus Nanoarchaeia archaeon]